MKPYYHAVSSAKKYGGTYEDYLPIHNMMDSSKGQVADARHRAIFHTSFGCFIIEQIFGTTITNSDGKVVCTRDIAEQHIQEDFHGFIPTFQDFIEDLPMKKWMLNGKGDRPGSCKFMPSPQGTRVFSSGGDNGPSGTSEENAGSE